MKLGIKAETQANAHRRQLKLYDDWGASLLELVCQMEVLHEY